MKAQLFQVFRTYGRRPLVLLLAGIALLIAIGLFAQGFLQSTNISIEPEIEMTGNSAYVTTSFWDEDFRKHRASDITSLRLTDEIDSPAAKFPNLTPLVNLTTLKFSTRDFTREKLAEVQSLEELRALALQAPSIPKGTWTALGPKLRELEIPLRLLLSHPDEVSQLIELQMLRVDRYRLTPEALSVIARIPNLKYLVLTWGLTDDYADAGRSQPTLTTVALNPAALRPLAGHPSLEAIFAYWPPQTLRTIPALPSVQLYPPGFPSLWQSAMLLGLFFTAATAVIVVLQVWAHFVVQSASVVPHYGPPHQLAALIVLLGGSLVGAGGFWWSEIALLPGLVIALALPTAFLAILCALQSPSQIVRTLGGSLGCLAGVLFWFPVAISTSLPPVIAGEVVWFLRGEFDSIAIAILLVECTLLGWAFVRLPKLTHRVYETSSLPPGLSPWDPQQERRTAYGSRKRWSRLLDRGEQYGNLRGDSDWQKARLWRAGNGYRPRNAVMFGGMFIVFYIAMQILMRGGEGLFDSILWHTCMVQLGACALLFPFVAWGRRCNSLQVESLRPVRRKDLVRQLFIALALDQSLALIPFAILIPFWIAFPRQGGSVAESYSFIAAALAALVWIYALSTAVFAIKRTWVLGGYMVATIVLPFACFATVGIIADEMKVPAGGQILTIYIGAMVILVLAVGILGTTYRRSLRREWG